MCVRSNGVARVRSAATRLAGQEMHQRQCVYCDTSSCRPGCCSDYVPRLAATCCMSRVVAVVNSVQQRSCWLTTPCLAITRQVCEIALIPTQGPAYSETSAERLFVFRSVRTVLRHVHRHNIPRRVRDVSQRDTDLHLFRHDDVYLLRRICTDAPCGTHADADRDTDMDTDCPLTLCCRVLRSRAFSLSRSLPLALARHTSLTHRSVSLSLSRSLSPHALSQPPHSRSHRLALPPRSVSDAYDSPP